MIGPWKDVERLQRDNVRLSAQLVASTQERINLTKLVRKLTTALIDMKREGFEVPPSYSAPISEMGSVDPEVEDAILEFAKPGTSLYKDLHREAASMKGMEPAEIVEHIRKGGDTRDWEGL